MKLAEFRTKADRLRYACEQLGRPTTDQALAWLEQYGYDDGDGDTKNGYAHRVVNKWRAAKGLADTGDLPALTAEVLAELAHGTLSTKGRGGVADSTGLEVDEGTAALAARVASMRGRVPLQHDPALMAALSDEELARDRELTELARAKREQVEADALAKEAASDVRWHRRALAAGQRMTSPDARLAQLYRRSELSSRALVGVVVLGMVWSGVNVQHNLVPDGDMHKIMYWLSYGVEAMISIPIIMIMLVATTAARWGKELPRTGVVFAELGLLGITVGLNIGPHVTGNHPKWGTAAEYAIAPVMVGIVIWLHSWISGRYAGLIAPAADASVTEVRR